MNEKALQKTRAKAKARARKRQLRHMRDHYCIYDIMYRSWHRRYTRQVGGGDGFDTIR